MVKTYFDAPPTPAAPSADRGVIPIAQAHPEPHNTHRGPRTCEEPGICLGRYPACGQCDDPHPEDDALTLRRLKRWATGLQWRRW